jgi:hypothetical protein
MLIIIFLAINIHLFIYLLFIYFKEFTSIEKLFGYVIAKYFYSETLTLKVSDLPRAGRGPPEAGSVLVKRTRQRRRRPHKPRRSILK